MDRQTFFEHVRQSRLLPDEQLAALAARFPEDVPAQDVAAALVEEGLLTRFQAQQVWAGKTRGLVLGQYQVLDKLGEGGFGQVYKARHTLMDREVAVKVISPELVQDCRARDWFRREVLASTQLNHPNIVLAYDANEVEDVLFLVMEYVDGTNLDALVKARGPLPVPLACEMMRQAALALGHAHEKGMVHRDVKPANLLIAAGTPVLVKVVDFGLARLHQTAKAGTLMLRNDNSFLGTPDYVSPEQARNMHAVDIRSDLYSLGCTFYFALAGRRPFDGATLLEVLVRHLESEPEPLEALRPDVPGAVGAIVRRLMAKDPGARFQTPIELAAELVPWCLAESARAVGAVPAVGAAVAAGESVTRLTPLPAVGATALLPQLAFWDGPQCSRETAKDPDRTPPGGDGAADTPLPGTTRVLPGPPVIQEALPAAPDETHRPDAPPAPPFRAGDELRQCWRQWLKLVEAFARGSRMGVSAEGYRVLRGRLLEQCRAAGEGGARPAVLGRLESVIEPWLTAQTLAGTDPQTLASLLRQCAELDRELDRELGGGERRSLWPVAGVAAVLLLALGAGWWLSGLHGWPSAVEPAADWVSDLFEARPVLFLAVSVPAVALAVICGLSRLLRA